MAHSFQPDSEFRVHFSHMCLSFYLVVHRNNLMLRVLFFMQGIYYVAYFIIDIIVHIKFHFFCFNMILLIMSGKLPYTT